MTLLRFSPHRDRIPPGQHVVGRLPVLQAGAVQHPDRKHWRLVIDGLIEPHLTFAFADLLALPATELVCDIHCVTGWSNRASSREASRLLGVGCGYHRLGDPWLEQRYAR